MDLITTFNNLRIYIATFHDRFKEEVKQTYAKQFDKIEEKLIKCFIALNLQFVLPPRFDPLNIYLVQPKDKNTLGLPQVAKTGTVSPVNSIASESESEEQTPGTSNQNPIASTSNTEQAYLNPHSNISRSLSAENFSTNNQIVDDNLSNLRRALSEDSVVINPINIEQIDLNLENREMEKQQKFLSFCGSQISKNYNGDILAFVNSVKLLKSVQGNHAALLLQFVKTKLVGKALETLDDDTADTIDRVIEQLESKIKPDNSKVIAGRIIAYDTIQTRHKSFLKMLNL